MNLDPLHCTQKNEFKMDQGPKCKSKNYTVSRRKYRRKSL